MIAIDEWRHVESPIELDMLLGFRTVNPTWIISGATVADVEEAVGDHRNNNKLIVAPQVRIGRYRVDFIVGMRYDFGPVVMRIVECDGYHFHRSTDEQIERDRKRDAALPYPVLRIRGHHIHKDCFAVAHEVLEELTDGRLGRGTAKRRRKMLQDDWEAALDEDPEFNEPFRWRRFR